MPTPGKFRRGDRVRKVKGSSWHGLVVGEYSTSLTLIGYCVESEREPGSVQLYPEAALELVELQFPGALKTDLVALGNKLCDRPEELRGPWPIRLSGLEAVNAATQALRDALAHANHMQRLTQDARNAAEASLAAAQRQIDAQLQALREAASIAYRICAETHHVSLGDKISAAILARTGATQADPLYRAMLDDGIIGE